MRIRDTLIRGNFRRDDEKRDTISPDDADVYTCTSSISECHVNTYVQGGALNRGLKCFFSIYMPSCLIKAYIRPEKYCFVWAGPLANHPFNFNLIFLSDSATGAAERATCFADLYRR